LATSGPLLAPLRESTFDGGERDRTGRGTKFAACVAQTVTVFAGCARELQGT
jgi:hypothetical protein